MSYALLKKACDDSINPESLASIEARIRANEFEDHPDGDEIIRQFREFMYGAGRMMAPRGWSREAQLDHLIRYIRDKMGDQAGCQSEDAEIAIRQDVIEKIEALL